MPAKIVAYLPRTLTVTSRDLVDLQAPIKVFLDKIAEQPHSEVSHIKGIVVGAAATVLVDHKLRRSWVGFLVCNCNANAVVYHYAASTADRTKYLAIRASATATVDLLVF